MQALTGVVDELRVWTSIRTDAQIADSFESGVDVGASGANVCTAEHTASQS
jgi:hypothetical protein